MYPVVAAGIDLSGRTTGTTAIAWVEGRPPRVAEVRSGGRFRGERGDAEIVDALLARRPGVVALDAPLGLPHSVVCTDPNCTVCFPADGSVPSYGSRAVDGAEAWASVRHAEKAPMPTVMVAAIAFRAIYLRRLLSKEGVEVIETWPMGVFRAIARNAARAASGRDGDDSWRRALLASVVGDLPGDGCGRDVLDAVAAAYAGWCRLAGTAVEVRADGPLDEEGSIWIPQSSPAKP